MIKPKAQAVSARHERHERVFSRTSHGFLRTLWHDTDEKNFLQRIGTFSLLGFLLASALPQLPTPSIGIAAPPPAYETPDLSSPVLISDDGFLLKPEIWSEVGDRSGVRALVKYIAEDDDTVDSIAKKFGISPQTIVQNNGWFDASKLKAGHVLKIPAVDGFVHKVRSGQTLSHIAKLYSIDSATIAKQNSLDDSYSIRSGQSLVVPGAVVDKPVYVAAAPPRRTTQRGQSLPRATAPITATPSDRGGKLLFPTRGVITQRFHYGHYAYDIADSGRPPIWAAESGTVVTAKYGWNGGYGNYIIIDHGGGMRTLYGHNQTLYVNEGDQVARGTTIAKMGNTGRVRGRTGIHLHFEVRIGKQKKNPGNYF